MKIIWIIISCIGLLASVLPSILVFYGVVELQTHKTMMLVGMILWFVTAPSWLKK